MIAMPEIDLRGNPLPELVAVAANPKLRKAVWKVLTSEGFKVGQIQFSENQKGRHSGLCTKLTEGYDCIAGNGTSRHPILDRYNAVEAILLASGLIEPLPEGAPFVGQVITDAAALDTLPAGTIIKCVKMNPSWPEVFMHTGRGNQQWLHLDPSDRDDGENTEYSEAVLRWHVKGSATVLHVGSGEWLQKKRF